MRSYRAEWPSACIVSEITCAAIFAGSIQARTLAAAMRMVATMIALTMLITLPAERAHSFSVHLRAPVVRRDTQRFSLVAQSEAAAALQQLQAPKSASYTVWDARRSFSSVPPYAFVLPN